MTELKDKNAYITSYGWVIEFIRASIVVGKFIEGDPLAVNR